jgi:hypothetical protein
MEYYIVAKTFIYQLVMPRLIFDFLSVMQAGWKITGIPVINELNDITTPKDSISMKFCRCLHDEVTTKTNINCKTKGGVNGNHKHRNNSR